MKPCVGGTVPGVAEQGVFSQGLLHKLCPPGNGVIKTPIFCPTGVILMAPKASLIGWLLEPKPDAYMAEEKKDSTDGIITSDAAEPETEPELDKPEEEGEAATPADSQIDYEAELKREKLRGKPDPERASEAFKERKQKREEKPDDDEEEKPVSRRDLRDLLAEERRIAREEALRETVRERARKIASTDAEADLIAEIHKNRHFPDGMSLDEQIEESYAIANRKRIMAQNEELKRALRSKETSSSGIAATHRDGPEATAPKLASQDVSALKSAGFSWNGKSQRYEKPIAGGKKALYFDPKTKKRWVEDKE